MTKRISMKIRESKGAAIVESAIIYPIIVLTASILIFIIVNLYTMVVIKVDCDLALRGASGEMTGTILAPIEERSNLMDRVYKVDQYFGLFSEIAINNSHGYSLNSLKKIKLSKEEDARFALHDECRFIRNANLISDGLVEAERFSNDDQ